MSTSPSFPAPGAILAQKYRVVRTLGQGGMGFVVEARHTVLDDRVALKFLLPSYAESPLASARFLQEARAAVRIKSEHVVRIADVGTLENGSPYMVMEFLEGSDLSRVLAEHGVLPIADAVDYVLQACDAIGEAHFHGIVHRDIKPANLFLGRRPNGAPLVKLLDFGISKVAEAEVQSLTTTTAALGSELYMSPEQMQQSRSVDARSDIYSLGITLYELLTGRQPFYAETVTALCGEVLTGVPTPIRSLRAEVPEALGQVLEKAYARDREHRYQTIGELVTALAPFALPRSQPVVESIVLRHSQAASSSSGPLPVVSTAQTAMNRDPNLGNTGRPVVAAAVPERRRRSALPVLVGLVFGAIGVLLALAIRFGRPPSGPLHQAMAPTAVDLSRELAAPPAAPTVSVAGTDAPVPPIPTVMVSVVTPPSARTTRRPPPASKPSPPKTTENANAATNPLGF